MKILSQNCNGIRSSIAKGLFDLVKKEKPDIVCLQEVKALPGQMSEEIWKKMGYEFSVTNPAEKKGYSGVAIFSKLEPKKITLGIGDEFFDKEGRSITLEFSNFFLENTYFPSGTSGEERQALKMRFLDFYFQRSSNSKKKTIPKIICGDVNIAHTPVDIHDPKGNAKNSGFLPEERAWLTQFLDSGFTDAFRKKYPSAKDEYSWWTYRFGARDRNKGWRIDYFFVSSKHDSIIEDCYINRDHKISDHAAVVLKTSL